MVRVQLNGWKSGLEKVELTKLIRGRADLPLHEAKAKVDNLLAGRETTIQLATHRDAQEFADEAARLGAICSVETKAEAS